MKRVLAGIALAFFAAGCAFLESLRPPAPPPAAAPAPQPAAVASSPDRSLAEELVAYMGRLRSMSESALSAETQRQRQAAARGRSEVNRLKFAMALAVAPQSDEADILAIVEPLARKDGSGDEDVRSMASFLQAMASERRRLKESAAAKLRDERKARDAEKQRAEALQERAAQLQQKLDALTDLEKSLSDPRKPSR